MLLNSCISISCNINFLMIRARQKYRFVLVITSEVMFKVLYLVCVCEKKREMAVEKVRKKELGEERKGKKLVNHCHSIIKHEIKK